MIHKAYFDFQAPEHGWLPIEIRLEELILIMDASDVGNDPIRELLDLLACCRPDGPQGTRVSFWLEPAGYILEAFRDRQAGFIQIQVFYEENLHMPSSNNPPVYKGELPASEIREALITGFEKLFRYSVDNATAWTQEPDWEDYRRRFEKLATL